MQILRCIYRINNVNKNSFKSTVYSIIRSGQYYYDLKFQEKIVVVIGNEAKGVSKEIQDLADKKIKIPMLGKTESLNASVAASVMIYEYVRGKISN